MNSGDLLNKVPPHYLEGERALLGVLLRAPGLLSEMNDLKEEDFYDERNRLIFRAVLEVFDKSGTVDTVLVVNWLKNNNLLQRAGGEAYIFELPNVPTGISYFPHYKKSVVEKSLLRALIYAAEKVIENCYTKQGDVETVCNESEKLIFEVTNRRLRSDVVNLQEVLAHTLETISLHASGKMGFSGYSTGYSDLDARIFGLNKQDMIVLAARPGMGKTAFALNIALRMTDAHPDVGVLMFSLEMSSMEIAFRALSCVSRIPFKNMRSGMISKEQIDALVTAAGALSKKQIFLDDTPAIPLNELRAKARRVKSKTPNLGLIIIDHIQLIRTTDSVVSNRVQELSYISRSIKALAKELDVPILVLSQLSREVEKREDRRPLLSDLRESGAIEQDADLVMFLFREFYYNKHLVEKEHVVEVIIAKQRNGETGSFEMAFFGDTMRFELLEKPSKGGGSEF